MYKAIIIIAVVIIVVVIAVMLFMSRGNDVSQYQHLINPAISELPDQNMLVVEAAGEPGDAASKAFKLLYQVYYKLEGVAKNSRWAAPRSRWSFDEDAPQEQMAGLFGLPIPDAVTELPEFKNPDNLNINISKWEYGTIAEILHTGPYDQEVPTVKRLHDFIEEQGYTVVGAHEEEYLKGPGMLGAGNAEKYMTIIRYRVEKTAAE